MTTAISQHEEQQRQQQQPTAEIEGMETLHQYHNNNNNNSDDENNYYNDQHLTEAEKSMRDEELSFYSNSTNDYGDDNIWGLLSGIGGNIYEWYDFAVYGLLAPEIGASFFPSASKELQLINSFGVYLAAFLMRPLGAILFGEMGDRIVGRKNALVFSIVLITVPSIMMGCLPTYNTWGWISPVLLVLLRMLQGLSMGGQLAGSYILSIEQSSAKTRGFRGSLCDASSVGGFLLASAVTTITRSLLSKEQVDAWGWRVPFLFSLLLAPLLYHIVNNAEESKLWAERSNQKETEQMIRDSENAERPAIVDLFSSPFRRRQLAGMVGVLGGITSSFYTLFLFTPVYLSELRGVLNEKDADLMNFVVVGIYIFLVLLAGKLSDKFPHRMDLFRIGFPGIIVGAPAMFAMFESESVIGYFLAQVMFAFCLALVEGGKAAWEVELWMADPTLSFTGVAIGHNIAATIFGGTLPLVATFLFYRAQKIQHDDLLWPSMLPGFYITILCSVALYCISSVVRHPHDIRIGGAKLKEAVNRENRREKEMKQKKKKKIKQQMFEENLNGCSVYNVDKTDENYVPPMIS